LNQEQQKRSYNMQKITGEVTLEIQQGDIANQKGIKAIVNAANAQLQTGGGVAGAIHTAAGPELAEECRPMAPIRPGQAVVSGGHNLPNQYVIHCLGPVYGIDKPEDKLLAGCYRNALRIAEDLKIESIAFPAISTGAFGYPFKEATKVALGTIKELSPSLQNVKLIRFVLFSKSDYNMFEQVFKETIY
jgi:O-acetyl-ADP-ribose deacetylase (regulator of RNase III)